MTKGATTLNRMTFSIRTKNEIISTMAEGSYIAQCHLCRVSGMLSAVNKPFLLTVVMLNVVVLSVGVPAKVLFQACFYISLKCLILDCIFAISQLVWPP
jgi:hypothetical protein